MNKVSFKKRQPVPFKDMAAFLTDAYGITVSTK